MPLLRKMTLGVLCFLLSVHFGYSQTVCPAGSYGPSCLLDCDNTCVTDGCTVTDADTCGCDKDTGRCSKCISGYYTDECDVLCVPGCDGACARSTGNCEKCVSQTYGDKCDLNCNNCPYGCDQVSGTCLSGCQVENCMSCVESITTCDYCTDGYGLDEDGTTCCSDGCISQDTYGYPECQPHTGLCKYSNCKGEQFYGEYCQRCNTRIPNCETCGLDTVTDTLECLACSPPYVPTSTGASCCPEGCDSCDELICTSCKPGWFLYDTRCDTCGDYCTPPTDGSERCDSVTGGCLFGCLQGWHGSACDVECTIEYCNTCAYDEANNDLTCADCADTWYGDQCASCFNLQCDPAGECDQNGVCQGDCQPGYRGATCVERCDAVAGMENCDECHRTDQLCTLCKPGYFGPTCGEACSDNCVADNFGDRKCDLDTGACDLQCDPGYWQEDCRMACPNCASGSCNITSGYCQPKVCSQGFYGVMCNQPCPEECANNPNTLQLECDVDTGVCTHGCAYNFYGDFCNNYCHENCSTKNFAGDIVGTGEPLCSQSDGACHYGCVNGSYTPQCSKSCISSCVWDYCDITSGICQACHDNPPGWHCINADCPSGKHDKYCDEQCHPNCVDTCARYSSFCDACRVGWHGENCQTQCGECSGSSCFQYNGTCQSECNTRFYGETCNSRCPDDTCNYCHRETGICETCQPGLWGTTCDQSCSTSCEPSTDGLLYCDIGTGDCGIKTCRPGYWGSDCRANCPAHCRPDIDDSLRYCNFSTGACLDTGCDPGWFGEFCSITCSPTCKGNICDRDGQCDFDLGCLDKYYGSDCSSNCKETCNDNTCDRNDGECAECNKTLAERTPLCRTADCPSGFREVYCTETCPEHCLDSCDRYNSTCRECVMGWNGDTCQHKCRECSGISCFQNNGTCQSPCNDGYYGYACDITCPDEFCKSCDRETGECSICQSAQWGTTCDEKCSVGCEPSLDGHVYCDIGTGICNIQSCLPGYWSSDCQGNCPVHCLPSSDSLRYCNFSTGGCLDTGCDSGWFGEFCNIACKPTCTGNICDRDGQCDMELGCQEHYYGFDCTSNCKETCNDNTCDRIDGECAACNKTLAERAPLCRSADCPSGFREVYCTDTCPEHCLDSCDRYNATCRECSMGWYGDTCQHQCMECSGISCFQNNGTCQSSCNDRFYGSACNINCPDEFCKSCKRETGVCLTCQPAQWGTACTEKCSIGCESSSDGLVYCDIVTGDCNIQTCLPGYWGSDCLGNCPVHCRPSGDSLRYCDFNTGACLDNGCDSGWFGEFCNITCSPTCTGNVCDRDGQCDLDSGCQEYHYGFDCSRTCKETCNDNTCDRIDGECAECNKTLAERTPLCRTADCPSGFHEVYCTETCPDYCLDSCDRYNATCRECVMGWHGDKCQHQCRECSGISCFQNNGTCQSHCNDGYYGHGCNIVCPDEFCKFCHRETGVSLECVPGIWGTQCSEKCSVGCEPSIAGLVYCGMGTGDCDIHACLPGYWSSDCLGNCPVHCLPSSDFMRYCDFNTGACLDTGCDSGWFGEFCSIRCSPACTGNICDRDGQCDMELGCQLNYYGFDCSSNCTETCTDNTCDRTYGDCAECNKTLTERTPLCRTAACSPPKKGLMCNEDCPDECFGGICQRYNSTCESCNDGFYGDLCQEDCGACVDNVCNQETGVCDKQCRPGYYGDKCENICLHPGCYTCDHLTGECTECKATKYGENCDESCSSFCLESNDGQIYCDRGNGDCVENACAAGYHMPTCIRSCNDNCFPDQNGDKPCDIDDGSCDLGCAMYYYGDQCNQECSGNCLAGTCQRNGDCTGGCKTGFFASDCELTCSLKLTCTDRTCDIDTGKCAECDEPDRTYLCREADCPVGLWGEFCNETCPSNCADNKCRREGGSCIGCDVTYYGSDCDERCFYCVNDVCIQNDGTCEQGCVDGYYGQQCMTPCLYPNCKDCTRTTGVCITCEPGYYGQACDRECSPYCEDPATCSKDDGTCDSDTCVPGYWSPQCKESCSPYCNTNQGECDKTSGACAPCIRGYFNVDCTGFCTDRCKNSNCELRADNCIDGCRDGYWGNLCERPCSPNCQGLACHVSTSACLFGCDADRYYGDTCSTECNANCAAGVCNTTGYCTLGCAKGSHGDMCDLQCAEVSKCTDGTCDRQKGICSICDTDPKNILCPQADCNPGLWGNECGKQCASQLCLYNQCHRYDNVCKGCGTGDYGLYCNKSCGHCQTNSGCDQISGTCDQGCSAGWRGDMCMTPCDPLCQTCDRDTGACIACVARRWGLDCEEDCSSHCDFSSGNVYCEKDTGHCQSCEAGYWRPACTDTCPENCKASDLGDKICTIDNGYCSNGCQLTYYGDRCQLSCSTRCRNQLCVGAQDTCVDGCADGYWGPQCTHQCSSHCGVPGSCSTDGACYDDCEDGHYGRLCDSECIATCKDGKCDEQGSCPECRVIPIGSGCRVQVCELGFYGHLCEEECPGAYCQNNMCHRLDGDCEDGCLLGYYGLYCTQQCRCDNDGTDECTQTLGECVCKTGRKGIICDEYCSDGCVNRQCSSITGECEFGCNAGRYGPECESSCDNCAGQNCDANSGLCPGDCNVGWYGSRCEQTCLATCPLCDKNSGRCLTCDVDKYGDMCQSTCSDTCAPVAGDRACRQTDGQCVAGCLAGYYGDFCGNSCDNCYDGGACDSNGVCTQGCEAGWWGTKCDEVCGENCARGGSRYEATCRYETGVCDYDCVAGYYGDLCLNPCSDQCLNKVCSALNQCTSGCVTGYYGPGCTSQCEYCQNGACQQGTGNCQDGCQQGRWGPRCTSVCTQTCTNDECDPTYGDCRDCLVTPQGSGCRDIDTPTAAASTDDELSTGAVIGIAAGAVGIVIIFVILFVYCVVYKRKAHDAKQEIHLPSDILERMSTMRSHHSTVSSQYPVARVIGDDEKDFAMF